MPKEHAEVIKVDDEAEEEENLVEAMVRLFATTADVQGTTCDNVIILHTHNVNIVENFTIL